MPETPLLHYLRLQRGLDRDVLSALRVSAASIESELRRLEGRVGVGAAVRSHQLTQSQAYINREMARFWGQAGNTIAEHQANAAAEAAEAFLRSNPTLSRLFSQADLDYMSRSTRASAAQGLETAMQRVSGASYVPLAESVYNNAALTSGKVDDIVTSALARGASAAELAKDVRGFINPNTPGGVRYASMRLGRTELNNAFHASQIQQAQKSPWVTAVMWNLSGSHPKPDECNEYADDTHFTGGEAGQFKPMEVPSKPHPNCLCYTTTVDVGRDEFIKQFETGQYDEFLESEFPDLPGRDTLPPDILPPSSPARSSLISKGSGSTPGQDEMFWTRTFDGSKAVRQVHLNRLAGEEDFAGINFRTTGFKNAYLNHGETVERVKQRVLDSADALGARLNSPEEFSKQLFRGMSVKDPSIFKVGDTVPSDMTSWTPLSSVAREYSSLGSGDSVLMKLVSPSKGIRLNSKAVRKRFTHDEHLIWGDLRVVQVTRTKAETIVEVEYVS